MRARMAPRAERQRLPPGHTSSALITTNLRHTSTVRTSSCYQVGPWRAATQSLRQPHARRSSWPSSRCSQENSKNAQSRHRSCCSAVSRSSHRRDCRRSTPEANSAAIFQSSRFSARCRQFTATGNVTTIAGCSADRLSGQDPVDSLVTKVCASTASLTVPPPSTVASVRREPVAGVRNRNRTATTDQPCTLRPTPNPPTQQCHPGSVPCH